jgi:hypothetical protein
MKTIKKTNKFSEFKKLTGKEIEFDYSYPYCSCGWETAKINDKCFLIEEALHWCKECGELEEDIITDENDFPPEWEIFKKIPDYEELDEEIKEAKSSSSLDEWDLKSNSVVTFNPHFDKRLGKTILMRIHNKSTFYKVEFDKKAFGLSKSGKSGKIKFKIIEEIIIE